jgi:dihydroorotase-like cyclic amidohydrolase
MCYVFSAHVHLNEPGRTEWEGFSTGTRAALSGGVTSVIDMPLNSIPPTTTLENLEIKRAAAMGHCYTHVGFWGGIIPGNEVGTHYVEKLTISRTPSSAETLKSPVSSWRQGI